MLKRAFAYFWLVCVLSGCLGNVLLLANYQINKSSYKIQCENKARSKLDCNGKCALSKQLKKQEQQEKKSTGGNTKEKFESIFLNTALLIDYKYFDVLLPLPQLPVATQQAYNFYLNSIFQPPRA